MHAEVYRILKLEMRLKETISRCKGQTIDGMSKAEKLKQAGGRISRNDSGRKSRGSDTHMNAWAFSETSVGSRIREDSLTTIFC